MFAAWIADVSPLETTELPWSWYPVAEKIFCIVPQVGSISPRSMRLIVDGDTSASCASSFLVIPLMARIFLMIAAASISATSQCLRICNFTPIG